MVELNSRGSLTKSDPFSCTTVTVIATVVLQLSLLLLISTYGKESALQHEM